MTSGFGMEPTLYASNNLFWEIVIRMVLIPAVLLFLVHRFILSRYVYEQEGTTKREDRNE